MMRVGLLKTTLVNFPGRVAAAVFLPGCNLRCPFCHNAELAVSSIVSGPSEIPENVGAYVPLDSVYELLDKRKQVLGGLAISGGEPLLSPVLTDLIAYARSLGLAIKIDTNGTLPERLRSLISDKYTCPDMIALDVKTDPARYGELTTEKAAGQRVEQAIRESISILSTVEREGYPVRIEYRTVLVPGLVGMKELEVIASLLPANANWQLASFVPGNCLDPAWNNLQPYGPAETERLTAFARSLIPSATHR